MNLIQRKILWAGLIVMALGWVNSSVGQGFGFGNWIPSGADATGAAESTDPSGESGFGEDFGRSFIVGHSSSRQSPVRTYNLGLYPDKKSQRKAERKQLRNDGIVYKSYTVPEFNKKMKDKTPQEQTLIMERMDSVQRKIAGEKKERRKWQTDASVRLQSVRQSLNSPEVRALEKEIRFQGHDKWERQRIDIKIQKLLAK